MPAVNTWPQTAGGTHPTAGWWWKQKDSGPDPEDPKVRSLVFCPPKFTHHPFQRQQEPPAIFANRGVGVADTLCMVMAVTIIITLVGVSTPLGVITVVTLGTELPIVPQLSVRNIVLLDRLLVYWVHVVLFCLCFPRFFSLLRFLRFPFYIVG